MAGTLEIRASEIRAYTDCGRVAFCRISDSRILRLQVGEGDGGLTRVEIRRSNFDGTDLRWVATLKSGHAGAHGSRPCRLLRRWHVWFAQRLPHSLPSSNPSPKI